MYKSCIKIAALVCVGVVSLYSGVYAQVEAQASKENTIFAKDNQYRVAQGKTEEQRMLDKYIKNSRRKFNPRQGIGTAGNIKNRIIRAEQAKKYARDIDQVQKTNFEDDTTECHHHPKHVLKINTFGVYSGDYINVMNNNASTAYYLGLGAVQFTLKTEDNGLWKNGALSLFVANTHGDNPSANNVHDLQVFDNIEAPNPLNWKFGKKYAMPNRSFFYEFYYQQVIKNFRVLAGQSDLNYDFQYSNYAANLFNSSFGISPEVTVNVPTFSTYPFTAFGVRADYKFKDFFLRGAITQGNPGNHISNQYNFDFRLDGQYGIHMIAELEYEKMLTDDVFNTNVRAGIWHHTSEFMNFADSSYHKGNTGVYFIAEQLLYAEKEDKAQGLGAFVQTGFTPGDYNVINSYYGFGMCYTGLFKKRDGDVLAFGFANPIYNSHLIKDYSNARVERAIELNYAIAVNDNVSITPCMQYVQNPGFVTSSNNPLVLMVRMSVRGGELYNNR